MKYCLTILLSVVISVSLYADNLFAKVKTRYDKITTIQGNFSQTVCSENTGTCTMFEGKFAVARPYYSRLEVTSPEKQIIVTDSHYVYIYLIEKKKVYLQQADAGINFFKIFDMFLNEPEHYTITDKDSLHTVFAYKQDSLESSSAINDLILSVNNNTKLIEQFSFTDMTDTEMKFDLTNIKTNVKLSDKTFRLVIPKDVELIQY